APMENEGDGTRITLLRDQRCDSASGRALKFGLATGDLRSQRCGGLVDGLKEKIARDLPLVDGPSVHWTLDNFADYVLANHAAHLVSAQRARVNANVLERRLRRRVAAGASRKLEWRWRSDRVRQCVT